MFNHIYLENKTCICNKERKREKVSEWDWIILQLQNILAVIEVLWLTRVTNLCWPKWIFEGVGTFAKVKNVTRKGKITKCETTQGNSKSNLQSLVTFTSSDILAS